MNENNDMNEMLEFRRIKEMLVKNAMTEKAAQRFEQMEPFLDQARAEAALQETTEARKVLDTGNPALFGYGRSKGSRPGEAKAGRMLTPDQLESVRQFAVLSLRLTRYLEPMQGACPRYGRICCRLPGLKRASGRDRTLYPGRPCG